MKRLLSFLIILTAFNSLELFAKSTISGKIVNTETQAGIGGIKVLVAGTNVSTFSDKSGDYQLSVNKPGEYSILFSKGKAIISKRSLEIADNETKVLNVDVNSDVYNTKEVIVYGASKRAEKITESPAAVTAVFGDELERKSRGGQLANALAGNVGIDVLRNGANDFIVNTRGFNGGLNRRILVLQDGRDAAMPLLGAMEWNSFALPQEDFESMELVRGPSAALYGANAFNGVLLMKSYAPKDIIGTKVSLLAGDFETYKADIRHAGIVFEDFSYRINLGHSQMLNLVNRRDSAQFLEYAGLQKEGRKLTEDDRKTFSTYGSFRLDYDLTAESSVTGEFGYSRSGNEAYVFGLGRTFVKDAERPYVRLAYNSQNINVHAHYMSRFTPEKMWLLVPNAPLLDNSKDVMIDFQHNFSISDDVHFIWGVTEQLQYIRTYGTSIPKDKDVDANFTGVYAQADWKLTNSLKFVGSGRFDYASIHDSYISPRVSLVFSPSNHHQFRVSVNKGFQRPNYSELYRLTPDAPAFSPTTGAPVNFVALTNKIADEIALQSGQRPVLNLNLNPTRARAVGNDKLEVEKILAYEFGYKGAFGSNIFVTADFYYNRLNDFITNFLPGINPNIEKWSPVLPDSLAAYSGLVKDMVLSALSKNDQLRLSNLNGEPTFVVSNANVGKVDEYGMEFEIMYQPIEHLSIKADYSYFGYEIVENKSSQPLLPNTSPHRFNFAVNYNQPESFDAGISVLYSEEFKWLAGIYAGKVPSYAVVNLNAGIDITSNLNLGINVFNLLNRKHYQIFGGTYLPRMATARLSFKF